MSISSEVGVLPAKKFTFGSFSVSEMEILHHVYAEIYPTLFNGDSGTTYLPSTYQNMPYAMINGLKVRPGMYILAKSVFPFHHAESTISHNEPRPAKVVSIIMHSIQKSDSESISTLFATIDWPMSHHHRTCIGKPYELWCISAIEPCNNFLVPLNNFVSLLLTANYTIHNENVLVTVPLI